jgi:pimeloyl-ACP methyl ester carboxylesterase
MPDLLARQVSEKGDRETSQAKESPLNLILIHGALGAAAQLDPLRRRLEKDFAVHVVELDGHGATPPSSVEYSIPNFVGGVARAMDDVNVREAAIFGYSMGGYVALAMAAAAPARVSAVLTLGTKLAWSPEVAARETGRLDPATIRAKVPKFAAQLEERHHGAGGWEAVLGRTAALMTTLGARPVVDSALLGRIARPVWLMVGDRDALVSVEETVLAAKQVPKGEHSVLPDTPHPIEQVDLELVAKMVRGFLGGLSTR